MGYTIEQLREKARTRLSRQRARALRFRAYYEGEPEIIAIMDKADREAFRALLEESFANWCALVVNAVAERQRVIGFDFGSETANTQAWAIWQDNQMDAWSNLIQTDSLAESSAFVLVQRDETKTTGVEMIGESASQATVVYEPGSQRRRLAGYKRWTEDDGESLFEVLITPDQICTWEPDDERPRVEENPAGVVNLVEMRPQPRTVGFGRSELNPAIPFQDRINTTIFNRLVASDYGSFRQIWASGLKLARRVGVESLPPLPATARVPSLVGPSLAERSPESPIHPAGQLIKPFNVGADRLLVNENPEGRFGAIAGDGLTGFLAATEQDVQHLAAITQTPPHYLLGSMVNIGPEAMKAAETGLSVKTRMRCAYQGEAWREAQRIALSLIGDLGAVSLSARTIWADVETRSDAQLMDALVKAKSLGIPRRVLWERYGATPTQLPEWEEMARQEAIQEAQVMGAVDPYAALVTSGQ